MKTIHATKTFTHAPLASLSESEIEQVHGGRQVYLDGMLVEMSDNALAGLINSGAVRQIVVKGIAMPPTQGAQREIW
ncbi:MAG: hypothetical protein KDI82_01155 [Gammaproteobacteria bacterium]|nr:hypothetical protein [Gammaproteobacteria bacterium]